jgi:hypothetical protein
LRPVRDEEFVHEDYPTRKRKRTRTKRMTRVFIGPAMGARTKQERFCCALFDLDWTGRSKQASNLASQRATFLRRGFLLAQITPWILSGLAFLGLFPGVGICTAEHCKALLAFGMVPSVCISSNFFLGKGGGGIVEVIFQRT